MPKVEQGVLNFASVIDENTLEQARKVAAVPVVSPYVALMPDAHVGFGATVGSVVPTERALLPNAVGVDIGCGMIAMQLSIQRRDLPDNLGPLHGLLREGIQTTARKDATDDFRSHKVLHSLGELSFRLEERQANTALKQLGTLGSGNHFVEIALDPGDRVWIVLHSGSRGIGNQIARRHIERAKSLMEQYRIPVEPDLAYLVEGTVEFDEYWNDLQWAQNYAKQNREWMGLVVLEACRTVLGRAFEVDFRTDCHHNYSELEHHHGRNLYVTRKGAIRARATDVGIVPGSMGTSTFIVKGKQNDSAFHSAPHGAGRLLARGAAKRSLDLERFRGLMGDRVWNDRSAEALLDESPEAYKDIHTVVADSEALFEPITELTQIVNYKGT